jgi:ferredoxin
MKTKFYILLFVLLATMCNSAYALERFPPPDFESGYAQPELVVSEARQNILEYVDVAVLFVALCLASYLVLKKRSRKWIVVLMIFSLVYFGFYRKGCLCPIGGIQNVALTIFDSGYALPLAGILFVALPFVFTLFFGRVFCSGVCPLGAIQDLVVLKPMAVPAWLEGVLRLLAYIYLGTAILFAATGSAFIVCRYDPFISFFRLSGSINNIVLGICFLIVGIFVGRPYCRFFCPYGVLLRQLSRISKWRVTITPDDCIQCRLCEDSCPFGAIDRPTADWPAKDYGVSKKRLGVLLMLLPIVMFLGGWGISALAKPLSRMHATVRLSEQVYLVESGQLTQISKETDDAITGFRATGKTKSELYDEASEVQAAFVTGTWWLGGFLGFLAIGKLILLSIRYRRDDYTAQRAGCVACGRCYQYCPREKLRIKKLNDKKV